MAKISLDKNSITYPEELMIARLITEQMQSNNLDEFSLSDNLLGFSDVWIKDGYHNNMEVHCVCLKEYKPTTEKYQRGEDSWVMGTLSLHMLEQPATN